MKPLVIQLAHSFRVYAVDLPGYGRSDDPGRVLQLSELAEALASWIEVLRLSLWRCWAIRLDAK